MNHLAGPYVDYLQFCYRCGECLIDNVGACYPEGTKPAQGFPEGPVWVDGHFTCVGREKHSEDCKPVSLFDEAHKLVLSLHEVGEATNWSDKSQTDRVFAWYELDGLRRALRVESREAMGKLRQIVYRD